MAKVSKRLRSNASPQAAPGAALLIVKGALLSLALSTAFALFLAAVSLATDAVDLERYLGFVTVGVTVVSIFAGSVYAAQRAEKRGLVIGGGVGFLYVAGASLIGLELTQESLSVLVMINKLAAGVAAGALGGVIGANLR